MLTTTLQLITTAIIGQYTFGNALPTPEDHLKAPPGEKRVTLIMDTSGSMMWGDEPQPCPWWYLNHNINGGNMNKNEQMKAAAIGCTSATDGFLDTWASQIDFAITGFGYLNGSPVRQLMGGNFTRDLGTLEATILNLEATGSTPLQWGILEGGKLHNDYWGAPPPSENVFECDQHFNVVMTDGQPNDCGGGCTTPLYNHVPCGAPTAFVPQTFPPQPHLAFCVVPGQCDVVGAANYYYTGPESPDAVCYAGSNGTPCTSDAQCTATGEECIAGYCGGVSGNQNITTYTIGFGTDVDAPLLRAIAAAGGGSYYAARNASQLSAAFNEILNRIVNRTGRFTPPTITSEGVYVGNDSYSASFKAVPGKPWIGNVKAHCVVPDLLDNGVYEHANTNDDCLFIHPDPPIGYQGNPGTYLETNAQPDDRFSTSTSFEADEGGVGFRILEDYYNGQIPFYNAGGDPGAFADQFGSRTNPRAFFDNTRPIAQRRILTWTDGSGYRDVYTLTDTEMVASGCHRTRLLSYLYGYDPDTVDCELNQPTALNVWPLGATVNAYPTILRWQDDCTSAPGACLLAVNMDDGGVHFFDTANGHEWSVVIPKELFNPGTTANYPLASILDQPTRDLARRPFLNGPMFRLHEDRNLNGIIDGSESAYLVFSLGQGGAGYYFMDVTTPFRVPSSAANPIFPLTATPGTWTENMRNAVAKPYIGRVRYSSLTQPVATAVIPSGQVWYQDRPDEPFNTPAVGLAPSFDTSDPSSLTFVGCPAFALQNRLDSAATGFDLCTEGYPLLFGIPVGNIDVGIAGGCGVDGDDYRSPPLWYHEGTDTNGTPAGAIGRFTFPVFDLDDGGDPNNPADYVVLEDLEGNELTPRLSGTRARLIPLSAPFVWEVWLTQRPFVLRIHVDGECNPNHGVLFGGFHYAKDRLFRACGGGDPCAACDVNDNGNCTSSPGECNAGSAQSVIQACQACDNDGNGNCTGGECGRFNDASCGVHNPYVAFVDLARINGPSLASGAAAQRFANRTVEGSSPLMFTRTCPAGYGGRCLHAGSPRGAAVVGTADLAFMTCPITAEVRAYEEGGVARAFYVGDQCGQMWKFWTDNGGDDWNAKRIFVVNEGLGTTAVNAESRVFRRFDRPVDLVISQCKGNRSIGVYFGTGNTSRPAQLDNLELPASQAASITAVPGARQPTRVVNHNIVGAFFDSGQWDDDLPPPTLSNFQDVTPLNATEFPQPFLTANEGWYFALNDDEQMLRDPLVFQGVAFYKTNQGIVQTTTCRPGRTRDRVYAVNNCTSLPAERRNYLNAAGNNITPTTEMGGRMQWSGEQDIGGNLLLYVPPEGPPIVSVSDTSGGSRANIVIPPRNARSLELLWRWRVF